MYQNMSTLSELRQNQQLLQQEMHQLKSEMTSFNESMLKEGTDCLEQFPIQIRGKRAPVQPDDEQPDESNALKLLPPPLLPQKMIGALPTEPITEPISLDNLEPPIQESEEGEEQVEQEVECTAECQNPAPVSLDTQQLSSFTADEQETSSIEGDLLSTSLKVQGRVIPCIPCDADSPS